MYRQIAACTFLLSDMTGNRRCLKMLLFDFYKDGKIMKKYFTSLAN